MNTEFFRTRVNAFILMAPVATLNDVQSTGVKQLKSNETVVEWLRGMGPELFAKPSITKNSIVNNNFAGFFKMTGIGNISMSKAIDRNPHKNMSPFGTQTIIGHTPCGVSFRSLDHFRQICVSGKFASYDFGAIRNAKEYPEHHNVYLPPPQFDLSTLSNLPIVLLCGKEDLLASPKDYLWLAAQLTSVNSCLLFKEYELGHLGFLVPPEGSTVT